MADFNSKYEGEEIEALLDLIPNKVDKVDGKGLSTEDFTTALKDKLNQLSNYNDTTLVNAINKLRADFDTLVGGDTTKAIASFNDVVAFLANIEDSETLDGIIGAIELQIAEKQDAIEDIDAIREGARKGATAVQPDNIPQQIVYCTYGTTTYKEIEDILTSNQLPLVKYNGRLYIYFNSASGYHNFVCNYMQGVYYVRINTADTWGASSASLEDSNKKVTTLSSSSTDSQYPSAKCVYDALQTLETQIGDIDTILTNILG